MTGAWDDPDLVDGLRNAGVDFGKVVPKEESPWVSLLFGLILPTALLWGAGYLLMRNMQKKMGGPNAMSFGKSNAKIYVAAQTGKTFADVAGEDEAKEALKEIVDFLHNPKKYRIHRRFHAEGRPVGWPSRHRQNTAGTGCRR